MVVATPDGLMGRTETFGDWLARAIVASGLVTQRALAERSGIDVAAINRYVRGKVERPEYENIVRIAAALGRPVEEVAEAAGLPLAHSPDGAVPGDEGRPARHEGYTPAQVAAIVAYVESRPGDEYRRRLAAQRERRTRASYEAFCVKIFEAWGMNADLALTVAEQNAP